MDAEVSSSSIPALDPIRFEEARDALLETGFSPEEYRATFPDLAAAGIDPALHFLEWGYAERRRFPIVLRLSGMQKFRQLPCASRVYPQAVIAALANAWASRLPREGDRLLAEWDMVTRLQAIGAVPFFLAGDRDVVHFRRSADRGGRFLMPILLTQGLISPAVLDDVATPGTAAAHLVATLATLSHAGVTASVPMLWQFGGTELAAIRAATGGPADGATPIGRVIDSVRDFLKQAVPPTERAFHTVTGVLPPIPHADDGPGDLVRGTETVRALNAGLRREAALLGLRTIDVHDTLLGRAGTLDSRFIHTRPDGTRDYDAVTVGDVVSSSLWPVLDTDRPGTDLGQRFKDVLRALRELRTS